MGAISSAIRLGRKLIFRFPSFLIVSASSSNFDAKPYLLVFL